MPKALVPLPGDFILTNIAGRGGHAISILQFLNGTGFSKYEHVALCVGDGRIIEMLGNGIQEASLDKYRGVSHRWSTNLIPLTDQERNEIVLAGRRYLAQRIGYSWFDYAALVLRRFHIPAPHLKAYVESTGHMICSQFVAACYLDGGHPLYDHWTGYVTPGDLNQLLDAA
jgi:hypothetical protein